MITEYRNSPLSEYVIHNISTPESGGGVVYYLYIHPSSPAIIMRENAEKTEYRYADAGIGTEHWEDRDTLNYITFDKLARG